MFTAPVATRRAHAALHLVENEKDIVFVDARSQFLQPFTPEMIVTTLALDRLDDDGADVDVTLVDEIADLALGLLFARNHIGFSLRFWQRKIDVRTRDSRPVELSEQVRLARIGIRQAHGVTAASMKSPAEMQDLRAALAMACRHVLAHLPIHCRLQTILDCQRAALDEKITLQRRQTDYALKGLDKLRVALRVNVGVGDFDFRRTEKIALDCGIIKIRVIEPDRHRAKESIEIDERFVGDGVV